MSIPYNLLTPIFFFDGESTSSDEDSSSDEESVRMMLGPTFLTTAQQRTRVNMFGITNTEYTQTAITDPVLYIALYSTGDAPSEVDDYHWTFIVGPSHEEADSKGTLYNMEPRRTPDYNRPYGDEWGWLYNQPTIPLRGQRDLLVRLMIAEVADMNMLQAVVLRWGERITMREQVEWMSVRWVKDVLKSLDEEEGCLGRRMRSFESVEAKGRRLAETEEEKQKGYCLLDTRVSTRTFFERERATTLLSTATVDIAIKYPVLYVAVYKKDRSPHENDEYHWAFLIGPSNETAESEGICCGVEVHLDSDGRPIWNYNQTIVPLRGEDDLLARLLIADIVDLGPLGEIIRDHDTTPTTERTDSMAEGLEWNSLTWVRERLEMLERKPECFAYKCHDFSVFEREGRSLAEGLGQQRKKGVRPFGDKVRTRSLVYGLEKPDEDENEVAIKLDLARGEPNTISRAIQIGTGVLSAAAFELRRRVAKRQNRNINDEQQEEAVFRFKRSEDTTTTLAEREKTEDIEKGKEIVRADEEGKGTAAGPEGARVTTISFASLNKPEKTSEGKEVAKEVKEDEDETESEDDEDEDEEEDEGEKEKDEEEKDEEEKDEEKDEENDEDDDDDDDGDGNDKDDNDDSDDDGEDEEDENETESEDDDEDEAEDEEGDEGNGGSDKQHAKNRDVQTTVGSISTITLSR